MSILAQMPEILEGAPLPVLIGAGVAFVVLALFLIVFARLANLWLQAFLASGNITLLQLVAMSFRKVNPRVIVQSKIMAVQAGLAEEQQITTHALEAHYLAGGDVTRVIKALIAAQRSGTNLTFQEAAAFDLSGKDVLHAVKSEVIVGHVVTAQTVIQPAGSVLIEGGR